MKHLNLVLALTLCFGLIVTNSYCADEWLKTRPASTDQKIDYPTAVTANNTAIDRLLSNYREGLTVSYVSTSALSVSSGEIVCSNVGESIKKFRKNVSSTSLGWIDLDTGSEQASTTYYIYANCDADAETAVLQISASSSGASGVTYYKKIGEFYNDSSSNITAVTNENDIYFNSIASGTVSGASVNMETYIPSGYTTLDCNILVANNGECGGHGYSDSMQSSYARLSGWTLQAKCARTGSTITPVSGYIIICK